MGQDTGHLSLQVLRARASFHFLFGRWFLPRVKLEAWPKCKHEASLLGFWHVCVRPTTQPPCRSIVVPREVSYHVACHSPLSPVFGISRSGEVRVCRYPHSLLLLPGVTDACLAYLVIQGFAYIACNTTCIFARYMPLHNRDKIQATLRTCSEDFKEIRYFLLYLMTFCMNDNVQ